MAGDLYGNVPSGLVPADVCHDIRPDWLHVWQLIFPKQRSPPVRLPILALSLLLAMSATAAADCKADVDTAFEKLRASKSFRMKTTIVNEQGSLKMSVDYVLPDRMHQKVTLSTGASAMELIVIGTKAWSSNGQGWAEMPANFAEHVAAQIKQSVAEPPQTNSDFTCLGDKEFEGKSYAAYRAVLAAPQAQGQSQGAGSGTNFQIVYIDKSTGLPERNIVTADLASEKRLFDGTFSFPQAITIEPPATGQVPAP